MIDVLHLHNYYSFLNKLMLIEMDISIKLNSTVSANYYSKKVLTLVPSLSIIHLLKIMTILIHVKNNKLCQLLISAHEHKFNTGNKVNLDSICCLSLLHLFLCPNIIWILIDLNNKLYLNWRTTTLEMDSCLAN
jgi:hypothetical protein